MDAESLNTRPRKCLNFATSLAMRNCAIIHPLHLELETAQLDLCSKPPIFYRCRNVT